MKRLFSKDYFLIVAGILTNQRTDDMMSAVHAISLRAKEQPLDAITPGFDLLDALEPFLRSHFEV